MTESLSIIIPVYKERESIISTLEHLLGFQYTCPMEVIISDGEDPPRTLKTVEEKFGTFRRIIQVVSPKGRGPQMNHGVYTSKGAMLFFVHADTRIDQTCINLITSLMPVEKSMICGAFDLKIDADRPVYRLLETVISLRSRLTKIPYGDQGIFMTRRLFDRVGGYPPFTIMEDAQMMGAIKKTGIKPLIFKHRITTSARRWETEGVLYTTLRNWSLMSLNLIGVDPEQLAKHYT